MLQAVADTATNLKHRLVGQKKVLIICSNHNKLGDTDDVTGVWAEELATPYYTFKDAGFDITIASIEGGEVHIDPASLHGDFKTRHAEKFCINEQTQQQLRESAALADVNGMEYDAIFLPGGHGIAFDGPNSRMLAEVLTEAYKAGKVVSAVCHGPCGLVNATNESGKPLVDGKTVTGFSNAEEEAVGKTKVVPFLLEDKLKELGGKYTKGEDWHSHVEVDGNLVTGQNPQSSEETAKAVVDVLKGSR
jgi:putative intracellular protease/amidase